MLLLSALCLCLLPWPNAASKILLVNLWNSKSHAGTMLPLAARLAEHGHNVTLYTQVLNSMGAFEGVDTVETVLPSSYDRGYEAAVFKNLIWHSDYTPGPLFNAYKVSEDYIHHAWHTESFQKIRNQKWDLVVSDEMFANLGFSIALDQNKRFGTKIAMFSTTDMFPTYSRLRGLWRNPVMAPNYYTRQKRVYLPPNVFLERLITIFDVIVEWYSMEFASLAWMQKSQSHFGISNFQWRDVYSKTQLTFVDYPDRYALPTTVSNQMIYTGSYCKKAGKLPADLEAFMSDPTKKGVIYVAFGSMVDWNWAPREAIDAFFEMFTHFPDYNFIFAFKFDGNTTVEAGPNVRVLSWAPQKEILAHERTVLFFTHGGLKSLKEGICAAKPLLVLPFFADQFRNAANMVHLGFAEALVKTDLTTGNMVKQIRKMLADKRYAGNIAKVRSTFIDRIIDPLEEGVYWVGKLLRASGKVNFEIRGAELGYWELANADFVVIFGILCFLLTR